jgi:DNA-directed DNA polymerase III PolC
MTFKNFSSPHCHLQSLDTGSTIDQFVKREVELGTGTLTCTDHGYLGACRDVYRIAKENDLSPILGIEGYHRDDKCQILQKHGFTQNAKGTYADLYKYGHITIHALDQKAYEFLIKTVSVADLTAEQHGSERKPIFDWEDIEGIGAQNVTYTTGCLIGIVGRHVKEGRPEVAVDYYNKLRSLINPDNFYVEIFTHKCDKNWVNGVFFTFEDGTTEKYYLGKKVRTEAFEEISVADLAKAFSKGKNVGKLLAIKNRNTWEPVTPEVIKDCKLVQDFITNECTPWAPDGDIQAGLNKFLMEMARRNGDKVIISDDAHYAFSEEKAIQEARLGGMGDNFRFYGNYHRYSSDEAFQHFKQTLGMSELEFERIVQNNIEWADKFKGFTLKNEVSLPVSFYPKDTKQHMYELIEKHGRMDWKNPEMVARLNSEIELLHNNGTIDLLPYFFLAEEAISLYEDREELTGSGRGSAAGLQLSYLFGITHAPPLKHGLSQDRFLTLDRIKSGKLPDIDQDLPNRDILIPWLKERFGDNFAQVSTNHLLHLKSSLKDAARAAWGSVPPETEALCKSIPDTPQGIQDVDFIFGYTAEDGKEVKGLLYQHKGLQEYIQKHPSQWETVQKFLGIVRAKSRHASAYIVADKPIDSFIPLMTVNGVRATQYTAASCEEAGALKMDYLCLNTLTDLSQAIKLIQERNNLNLTEKHYIIDGKKVPRFRIVPYKGKLYDIWDLPEEISVFNMIAEGDTETVFQLNTSSAQKWLKEFNYWQDDTKTKKSIDSIEAISAFTSLDRPGPLDAQISNGTITRNMLEEYASRLRGEDPVDPIEFLNDALPETMGVMVYQEQLQSIYQKLSDCSGIDANNFRNLISKKKMPKVLEKYPSFMKSATAKIGESQAQKIWDQIYTFGQYGFNKSHSICYSYIAYGCAFLKYNYPLEWWCGVLRNAEKDEISNKFWKYCKGFVNLPDIKESEEIFVIKGDRIVAPLSILKGVGITAHAELIKNRPYNSLSEFCNKIAVTKEKGKKVSEVTGKILAGKSALNRGVIGKLLISGVMDSLFPESVDTISKLEAFEEAIATSLNKKQQKIKEEYQNLSPLKIFQYKKSILPVYTDFLPSFFVGKVEGVSKKQIKINNKIETLYTYAPQNAETIAHIKKSLAKKEIVGKLAFVDGDLFKYMNEDAIIDEGNPLHIVVGAYIVESRGFSYDDKKTGKRRRGMELTLDINGEIFKSVKWDNKKTGELVLPEGKLDGSVAIVLLSRWNNKYGFSIESVIKIEEPLTKDKSDEKGIGKVK